MSYPIVESSPKAKAMIDPNLKPVDNDTFVNAHHRSVYKFEQLKVGMSFTVPISEGKEITLRQLAPRYGKKLGRKFTVIKHVDYDCIEVARIG